ncbi:MAG: hypothetical protein EOP04_07565 [Proteobacteria bacterium]|nr:MAG: hypothetical protein EOP04_07565 [Pseudomonadota bacterium]
MTTAKRLFHIALIIFLFTGCNGSSGSDKGHGGEPDQGPTKDPQPETGLVKDVAVCEELLKEGVLLSDSATTSRISISQNEAPVRQITCEGFKISN